MPDTMQQHSAQQYSDDSQQKPQEEDTLEATESESECESEIECESESESDCNNTLDKPKWITEWAAIAKVSRTMGVPQNAASKRVSPDAASDNGNNEPSNELADTEDDITSVRTEETARIRIPHPHDVLCGRNYINDRIYHRVGNVQFRAWVLQRKTNYRLALSNDEKKLLQREVIVLVQNQNPPGRFLQRDPTHAGWWMEVDDGKVMVKIRLALRDKAVEKTRLALRRREATQTLVTHSENSENEPVKRPEERSRFDGNGETEPPIDETAPVRLDDLSSSEVPVRQARTDRTETEDGIASARTQETAKIRTPHPHDVLSGHGSSRGAIYCHAGYVQFRAWVSERKLKYRVASNRDERRLIVREVIVLVQNQNPPGRFLQRDPTDTGWWIEAGDDKAVVKTRFALGRGAAKTVAACCEELGEAEPRGEEEFERPEKRSRFDGNGEAPIDETASARLGG
jgi:hypothetical protein